MKHHLRWVSCSLLLAAGLGVLAACSSQAPSSGAVDQRPASATGPRVAIDQDSFDFGKVPLDKTVSRTFVVKNVGTAPLILTSKPTVRAVQGC